LSNSKHGSEAGGQSPGADNGDQDRKPERLQKIISAYGAASRRAAEKMILEGRVTVNGLTAKTGQSAVFDIDVIAVDGEPLAGKDDHVYIMLNKPGGYLTTVSDDRGRKTVMELVADAGVRVYPVGRLDLDSEGLLLFTNDGAFANKVGHPSNNKIKTYQARVRGDAAKAAKLLAEPVKIDEYTVHAIHAGVISLTSDGGTLEIAVTEGRNRQVRKMCAACGVSVCDLKRTSVGTLELGSLESGKWRYLTQEEVLLLG